MNDGPKISISDLSVRFGRTEVLSGLDLKIERGRKSVLIGPAASGKTVLMKCLSGVLQPSQGRIEIDGALVGRRGSRAHGRLMKDVGVLFQQGGLFDGLPVWKNVAFRMLHQRGFDERAVKALAIEHLAAVNLPSDTADLFPAELSGGMQKRVGIARALLGAPSLLLLDEPTAGLDPITTRMINSLIDKSIRGTGTTVLAITSDMNAAVNAYDDLAMLHGGRIVWRGPTADIAAAGNAYVDQMVSGGADGPIRIERRV